MYRTGAVISVAQKLAKYRLDLEGVQEARLVGKGRPISTIGNCLFYCEKGK